MRFILISALIAIIVASVLFYFKDKSITKLSDDIKETLMKGEDSIGLTWVRSEANVHFAYISKPKVMGKFKLQAEGAKYICFKHNYNKLKNCEVYVWEKKEDVARSLPIIRTNVPVGYYHIQDEKIVRKKILGI